MNELPLRDIHLPDPVSWWPPAIGWWILLVILLLIIALTPRFIRWLKHKPLKTHVQHEFSQIKNNYQQHKNDQRLIKEISVFLRRAVMSYTSRYDTASLTGKHWLQQLNALTAQAYFNQQLQDTLTHGPYTAQVNIPSQELLNACDNWVKALPKKQLNAKHAATGGIEQ